MAASFGHEARLTTRDIAQLVQETPHSFRVRADVYTDPRVFDEEMRRIFEKNWVYVGHESQVARPGDYITTNLGRQPVIVSRGEDGRIRVFLNACRHRGSVVCREGRGHASDFTCAYHGWVYANDGRLMIVREDESYPEEFQRERDRLGLRQARAAVYRGLIFANLTHDGESLEAYLGEVKHYIDLWADLSPAGTVTLSRPHALTYNGNWKLQTENSVDNYHAIYVHHSAFSTFKQAKHARYIEKRIDRADEGRLLAFDNGHGILQRPGLEKLYSDEQREWLLGQLTARHGPERAKEIFKIRHIHIFPNVCLMDANIRVVQPVSVDVTNVNSYFMSFDDVPRHINETLLSDLQRRLAAGGCLNTDDFEIFARVQTGMPALDWVIFDNGVRTEIVHPNGVREGTATEETPQRGIYRGWLRAMGVPRDTAGDRRAEAASA